MSKMPNKYDIQGDGNNYPKIKEIWIRLDEISAV